MTRIVTADLMERSDSVLASVLQHLGGLPSWLSTLLLRRDGTTLLRGMASENMRVFRYVTSIAISRGPSAASTMSTIKHLLGSSPASSQLSNYLTEISSASASNAAPVPEVKSYSDAVYFNYYALGLSLLFTPINGYNPKSGLPRNQLNEENIVLGGIDIYNMPKKPDTPDDSSGNRNKSATAPAYTTYPTSPITLVVSPESKDGKPLPSSISIEPNTTGKDFLVMLGEPDRKGGGAGPSSGSIQIWLEWSKNGIMVEFGGDESRGPQAWERGKDAVWKVLSIFQPKAE